jgi:hypothetical protein
MVKHDIYTLEKFSHFHQLVLEKNKAKNAELFRKESEIVNRVIETIKNEPLKRAEDIRSLPKILKDKKAKKMYLNKEVDFNNALEKAKERHPEHTDSFLSNVKKVTHLLQSCNIKSIEEIKKDGSKKYILKSLYKEVKTFCKKVGIKI